MSDDMMDYEFTDDTNEEEEKVLATIAEALSSVSRLIESAKDKILYGQYETYLKDFAYAKFLIGSLNKLQETYDALNDPSKNVRISDLDDKIEEIMSHIKEYEPEIQNKNVIKIKKEESKPSNDDDLDLLF